jgi:hypothetical protein
MATIHEIIKNNSSSIAAIFSTIAVIGGAVIYVESNFANAKDLKEISENQQKQLKIQSTQQRQMTLFQLEYYEDKLKKLQDEKRIAIERDKLGPKSPASQARGIYRTPEEIQEDIDDIKKRREYSRKIIEE